MRILGMSFILLAAVIFAYARNKTVRQRTLLLEELCDYIKQVKTDVGCYLKPINEIRTDSVALCELGFFSDVERYGVREAYLRLEEHLFLTPKEKGELRSFFSALGRGYVEDEMKLIDSALSDLNEALKRKREEEPKEKKLTLTLSCAASMALIILLL